MKVNNSYDVAIIGGGPAGSTAAFYLAKQGLKVILFEKEKFPRPHVGESLLPFCYDIFQELGVLDEMEKRFQRKPGAVFSDDKGINATTYCFKHVVDSPKHLSFHVRRDEFDKLLLDNAKSIGATVIEECRVGKLNFSDPEHPLLETKRESGVADLYQVKFVLDASGRDGVIAKQERTRVPNPSLKRTAFHSQWRFDEIPEEIKFGMIRIVYLNDNKKGWIWMNPSDEKVLTVGLAVDNDVIKDFNNSGKTENWQSQFYHSELRKNQTVREILSGAQCEVEVAVNGDYSYISTKKYNACSAMIGDSGQFIDPIFSSGIFIAMKSAQLVAQILPKYIEERDETLLSKTYDTIANGYATVEALINIYYHPEELNFSQMKGLEKNTEPGYEDFKQSYTLLHYLLAGDFFEKGDIYQRFFNELKTEKKFSRWKNLVKWETEESGVFNNKKDNCGEHLH